MAAFGTGINAALGRIDYTPYLQGASQGSAAIGRGIESLGQGVAGAIKEYSQNKEMRDLLTQNNETQAQKALAISQAFQNNPQLFGNVQPISDKTLQDLKTMPNMSMGKLKNLNAELNAAITKYEPVIAKKAESDRISQQLLQASGSPGGISYEALINAGVSPEQAANIENTRAQTKLYQAQAGAAGQPKSEKLTDRDEYFNALVQEQESKEPGSTKNPAVLAQIRVKAYSPSQGQNITVNQGEDILNRAFTDLSGRLTSDVTPALSAIPSIDAMEELLSKTDDRGIITGTFAPAELAAKAALNRAGISNFKDVASTQEYLGTSGRLVATIIKDFGAGTGLSDADREYAKKIAAGDITMDKQALKKLVSIARTGIQNKIKTYNQTVDRIFSGNTPQDDIGRRLKVPDLDGPAAGNNIFDRADAILKGGN
jgi:hypothetical protein